ncbi:MAG TPA: nitrilase-related carbon-nitrogen hydrolase [Puia sp.]|nr:nitrilase-related carbon-nitrogen hydrolase [Puia sp.]
MKQESIASPKTVAGTRAAVLLSAVLVCGLLSSPKYGMWMPAWLYPVCLMVYFRHAALKRKGMWAFLVLTTGHVLADAGVVPFPMLVVVLLGVCQTLMQFLLYRADARVARRTGSFAATLFLPALAVGMEYLNTIYGGGVWWSVANMQYPLSWLVQLASVTGIWGISFVLYWTASVMVWALARRSAAGLRSNRATLRGLAVFACVMAAVLGFGWWRYSPLRNGMAGVPVRVAGVTVPLINVMETFCRDYNGEQIIVNPRSSVTDPVIRKVGQAEASYVETADTVRFRNTAASIRQVIDSLFELSQQAVGRGAKIVSWSEGNAIVWKAGETSLVERGQAFATRNKVYLLMTACVVHPGKMRPGDKFLENEAVLIGPDGAVEARFHKNHPVPMVEASRPGDGVVPVLPTPLGRLGVSICYDADHPVQMRQLGEKHAGLLLLPSGDWFAISQIHSHMAVYRAVENGCSIFREVSDGLSIAADYRGRPAGSRDFFHGGSRLWMADLPVAHVSTLYVRLGDWLPRCCLVIAAGTLATLLLRSRRRSALLATNRMVPQL